MVPTAKTSIPSRPSADSLVRGALAAILLAAGAMKVHELATTPVHNCAEFACRWTGIAHAHAEILLGLWLLSGIARLCSHAMAAVCFAVFAAVALHRAVSGEVSCGCFGLLEVNPWYTLALDVAAVAALLLFRPVGRGSGHATRPARAAAWIIATIAICGLASWPMITYRPALLAADGAVIGDGAVLLWPADWPGNDLPLLAGGHIASSIDLRQGEWTLILYRRDCRGCRKELARRDQQARQLLAHGLRCRTVAAELPASAAPWPANLLAGVSHDPIPPDSPLLRARLDSSRKWFLAVPLVVALRDGKVTSLATPRHAD